MQSVAIMLAPIKLFYLDVVRKNQDVLKNIDADRFVEMEDKGFMMTAERQQASVFDSFRDQVP